MSYRYKLQENASAIKDKWWGTDGAGMRIIDLPETDVKLHMIHEKKEQSI